MTRDTDTRLVPWLSPIGASACRAERRATSLAPARDAAGSLAAAHPPSRAGQVTAPADGGSAAIAGLVSEEAGRACIFTRERRTELLVDIVESTRLLEHDEDDAVSRWRSLLDHIEHDILPELGGRLVRSLGDGVQLDFADVRQAVTAALAIQAASNHRNCGLPSERQMLLRMAIESSDVVVDRHDVYGRGVMIAARLLTVAGPGEIVASANVRDQLTPELDADVEDLGDCYVKHLQTPLRAYRVGPPGPRPLIETGVSFGDLLPTIAVIPFEARMVESDHLVLGEVLADEMIGAFSKAPDLNVISRLSTTPFRGRGSSVQELAAHLNADYVLSGTYRSVCQELFLDVELAESPSARVVWRERLDAPIVGLLHGDEPLVGQVVAAVSRAILSRELQRARSEALPTLKGYTLLLGAIALMHRLSPTDFDRSRRLLDSLISRATRQAVPRAWLGKWHVLRVQQGWSPDPSEDAGLALECTKQALDADPDCSLALAVDGFVHTNLLKRLDVAEQRYDLAIENNPSDSLAWLLKGTLHAFCGQGEAAVVATERALMLSPLDPHRYFYESLAATAALTAHRFDRALALATRSLRANRTHTSTLRAVAIAQWQLGMHEAARETARELMRLEPSLTVSAWQARSPSAGFEIGREWARVLREVGVPA